MSQPTVSRAVKALTDLVTRALDGYLITAEEVAPGCDYVLDGTLMPCWSWKAHPELWSGKHKRTGLTSRSWSPPPVVWCGSRIPARAQPMTSLPWTPPACSRASTSAGGSPTRATSDEG